MNASPSYVQLLATYNGLSEKEAFSRAYERNSRILWQGRGFYDFLIYQGGKDIGLPNLERLLECGIRWGEKEHIRDKTLKYYPHGCGDTLFCGRCALAKSHQRASHGLEVFAELIKAVRNNGIKLECEGLEIELTIPRWLSELFCNPSNRPFLRRWTERFFKVGNKTIQEWFKRMGIQGQISGVNVLHFWKSGSPWKPHVHLHFLLAPVSVAYDYSCLYPLTRLYPLPHWYESQHFDLLRSIWKEELEKEFGEGIEEKLNVHVNYLKRIKKTSREKKGKDKKGSSLQFRLEYMFRPQIKDFAKCLKKHLGNGMFEVEMIPENGDHKERVTGIVPYKDLRNFIDLLDAFSIGDCRDKIPQWKLERKDKEIEQRTTLSYTIRRRKEKVKEIGESIKENNPRLYEKITKKMSRRNRMGKGHLERIRWFGFLAKRNIGEFFKDLDIEKKGVEPQWKDTGRQLEYLQKTDNGVELKDVETGEIIEIPSILIHNKPLNVSGKKWVWKYGENKGSP